MARAARFTNRFDSVLFGGCILLSLVSMVLPPNLREPVAGGLRRSLVHEKILPMNHKVVMITHSSSRTRKYVDRMEGV